MDNIENYVLEGNIKNLVASAELLWGQLEQTFFGPLPTDTHCLAFIMLGCFASELSFKYILERRSAPIRGHELRKLFDALPVNDQNAIIVRTGMSDTKFYENLDIVSNNFVDFRYGHETKPGFIPYINPEKPEETIYNSLSSSPVFIHLLYNSASKIK
jgi:hypothetical protein